MPVPLDRVLVVLPNWYGETLFAKPFLRALRQQRPAAFLATLGWPQCREVLAHNPRVNAILDYDERDAHRTLAGKRRLLHELRAHAFDAVFILRRSLSRTMLMALAGIRVRVGFANLKSGWLLTRRVTPARQPLHKASTYLPLLEAVGLCVEPGPYEYFVSDAERRDAKERLVQQRAVNGRPLVILHPGANWPHKRWATERFAALGDRFIERERVYVAITGGPGDVTLGEAIARRMRPGAIVLAGQTSLRQLAACLEQSRLIISNDTGVLHIAAALARPVVALYGPTSPQLTGPLGDPARTVILHHPECCPKIPCYRPDHPSHPGMDSITVDEVYDAARKLLGQATADRGTGFSIR